MREQKPPLFDKGNLWCPGCPLGLVWKKIVDVTGPNAIGSIGSSCSGMSAVLHPSPLNIPTIHIGMPGPAAAMTGISVALEILREKGKRPKDEKITVFTVAGDGGTADIGMAALSGAAERNDDGIYICFDNEAYMNTGIQRSSLTPRYSWTTTTLSGKSQFKKNLAMIMAAHRIPYVATATAGYVKDFTGKLKKARDMGPGFKFIHLLGPCPIGWRFPMEMTMEINRLAVETGIWPLYEVEDGVLRVTMEIKERRHVREYLRPQKRFSHLDERTMDNIDRMIEESPLPAFSCKINP
ncbi:MAG: pyruvate synthase subunit beta [Deltaproteobacteria bacterium]|nr:pyruvate synthase subunit beta [Deltaproteobacteria bacterium]